MTSGTFGVTFKTKSTSHSLFHEVILQTLNCHLYEDVLYTSLLLILNCCQAQECRTIITKVLQNNE